MTFGDKVHTNHIYRKTIFCQQLALGFDCIEKMQDGWDGVPHVPAFPNSTYHVD